jgi:hypothetical protein
MPNRDEQSVNIRSREKRWIVVTQDGRHSTIGRHSDPTADELDTISGQLDSARIAAWLAISEGAYYGAGAITLMMVRRLTTTDGDWAAAERNWREHRANTGLS